MLPEQHALGLLLLMIESDQLQLLHSHLILGQDQLDLIHHLHGSCSMVFISLLSSSRYSSLVSDPCQVALQLDMAGQDCKCRRNERSQEIPIHHSSALFRIRDDEIHQAVQVGENLHRLLTWEQVRTALKAAIPIRMSSPHLCEEGGKAEGDPSARVVIVVSIVMGFQFV